MLVLVNRGHTDLDCPNRFKSYWAHHFTAFVLNRSDYSSPRAERLGVRRLEAVLLEDPDLTLLGPPLHYVRVEPVGLFQPARNAWAFTGSKQCFSKSRITLLGPPLHYVRVEPVGLFQPARNAWAFTGSKQCFSKSRITLLGPPLHYVRVEPVGLFQPARNAWAFTGSKQCFSKSRITLLGPPFISCPFWPQRCQKNRTPPPCPS